DSGADPLDEIPHLPREPTGARGHLFHTLADSVLADRGDHPRRRIADAEQAPLSLGDDLELHRGLVEGGMELLELPERGPLRLADRLTCCLDLPVFFSHG